MRDANLWVFVTSSIIQPLGTSRLLQSVISCNHSDMVYHPDTSSKDIVDIYRCLDILEDIANTDGQRREYVCLRDQGPSPRDFSKLREAAV